MTSTHEADTGQVPLITDPVAAARDALAAAIGHRQCPGSGHPVHIDSVDGDGVATCPTCRTSRQTIDGPYPGTRLDGEPEYRAIELHRAPTQPLHLSRCYDAAGRLDCCCGYDDHVAERAAGIGDTQVALDSYQPDDWYDQRDPGFGGEQ
jgi:hypothetical protein